MTATHFVKLAVLAAWTAGLTACSTVPLPNIDFMNLSEFQSEVDALDDDYPRTEDVPTTPTDVRADGDWDNAARDLQVLGAGFQTPTIDPALNEDQFDAEFERLTDKGQAYKEDDPQ